MAERLKDMFFTKDSVGEIARVLKKHHSRFDARKFQSLVFDGSFEGMELKQRMRHTTECLAQVLPRSYDRAVRVLMKAAPEIEGFEGMCLPDFVERYGQDHWDLSLEAMALFTRYASSEFAIRPFILADQDRTMAYLEGLASDEHAGVRRFASEGCRPRLPWAMAIPRLKEDPAPILPILERLRDDESGFVRKSVANNLNDISRDHPDLVLRVCEGWYGQSERTDWIVKRACRTLLKAGNRRAMSLFGFADPRSIRVENLTAGKKTARIGDKVSLSFELNVATRKKRKIRLEYAVAFVKSGGKTSRKVFQISERTYEPGTHEISKIHAFMDLSTRKHYPGKHRITVIVNGVEKAETALTLRGARALRDRTP